MRHSFCTVRCRRSTATVAASRSIVRRECADLTSDSAAALCTVTIVWSTVNVAASKLNATNHPPHLPPVSIRHEWGLRGLYLAEGLLD